MPSEIQKNIREIHSKKSPHWQKETEAKALRFFKECTQKIPAYKKFLKKNKINSSSINSYEKFNNLPAVTKDSYLRAYSLNELCWDGKLNESMTFTSTSGSTGQPVYFPRNKTLELYAAVYHELFLVNSKSNNKKKSTLIIVCFGMGVWIGGLITYQAFRRISDENDQPISIITPGVNKKEIFEALKHIAPKFDNVILCAYPPFLKDIIDEGQSEGVEWKKLPIKIICAAEAFSEKFRDYIALKIGIKNIYRDITNIYGSADLGTMAMETPLSVFIRRLATENPEVYGALFPDATRLPTLAQFNPLFVNFEVHNGSLLCTGNSALPLIRYNIGDYGGVITYKEMILCLKERGIDLDKEARKAGITDSVSELPFVYVYERDDLSTKLYGAIIYPEYIKDDLRHPKFENAITGKFTISTKVDKKHAQYLEVNIELKPKVKVTENLKKELAQLIHEALIEKSAEHRNNATMMPGKVRPHIVLWKHEHPLHFKVGAKQKWIKN